MTEQKTLITRTDLTYFSDDSAFRGWQLGQNRDEEYVFRSTKEDVSAAFLQYLAGELLDSEKYFHAVHDFVGIVHVAHAEGRLDPMGAVAKIASQIKEASYYEGPVTDQMTEHATGIVNLAATFVDACAQQSSCVPIVGDFNDPSDPSIVPIVVSTVYGLGDLSHKFRKCVFETPHIQTFGMGDEATILFKPEDGPAMLVMSGIALEYDRVKQAVAGFAQAPKPE